MFSFRFEQGSLGRWNFLGNFLFSLDEARRIEEERGRINSILLSATSGGFGKDSRGKIGVGEEIQKLGKEVLFDIWESLEKHEEINKSTKRERGKLYQRENGMN